MKDDRAKLTVTRHVSKKECPWLDGPVRKGAIVYRYDGYTYGVIGAGVAVTLEPGVTPFFELPRAALAQHEASRKP